ncbi:MAG: hypothetical protein HY552_07225 [Elusimicrobia bacterium]|nr:hypothetical protein [Elusimicrobiota bacterium]
MPLRKALAVALTFSLACGSSPPRAYAGFTEGGRAPEAALNANPGIVELWMTHFESGPPTEIDSLGQSLNLDFRRPDVQIAFGHVMRSLRMPPTRLQANRSGLAGKIAAYARRALGRIPQVLRSRSLPELRASERNLEAARILLPRQRAALDTALKQVRARAAERSRERIDETLEPANRDWAERRGQAVPGVEDALLPAGMPKPAPSPIIPDSNLSATAPSPVQLPDMGLPPDEAWTDWLDESDRLADPAPSGPEHAATSLMVRSRFYERAAKIQERASLMGWLAAQLLLLPRAATLMKRAEQIMAPPGGWAALAAQEAPVKWRRPLESLKAYVPGLDLDHVVSGRDFFAAARTDGKLPGGYMTPLTDGTQLAWVDEAHGPAGFIYLAAHEGFHQGDKGYLAGERSLSILLGPEEGPHLWRALIEGYTEWRARDVVQRLQDEADAGAQGLPAEFERGLRHRKLWTAKRARQEFHRALAKHPYNSYVLAAQAIGELEGGRRALDALVSQGDAAPLYFLLGRDTLKRMGRIARGAARLDEAQDATGRVISLGAGLRRWLERALADAVSGRLSDDAAVAARERAATRILAHARGRVRLAPPLARERALRALAKLDLEERLLEGMSPEQVEAFIDRAEARRVLWRYWPDALSDWRQLSWLPGPSLIFGGLWAQFTLHPTFEPALPAGILLAVALLGGFLSLFLCAELAGIAMSLSRLGRHLDDWLPYLLRSADHDSKGASEKIRAAR